MPRTVYHREVVTVGFRDKHQETWEVEATIEVEALTRSMGARAVLNRTGKTIEIGGYVTVKRSKRIS